VFGLKTIEKTEPLMGLAREGEPEEDGSENEAWSSQIKSPGRRLNESVESGLFRRKHLATL